ncbi:ankyrin [Anaeromyces robustus]|uniref:Ankyrin n=1 Tax=Anaeromyces robustus TaxID=1754192 RepID=A0A1Y1VRS2_9FUNG|nr:ankyrin [Anaeromyces robustus]|eukprot:ORX63745.1 ankyrin [Anaeromyces robustus]
MDFKTFENVFTSNLNNKSNYCFNLLDNNKKLIEEHLGKDGNEEEINRFVNKINALVLKTKNNFSYINKILNHPLFETIYSSFRNSDILIKACKAGSKSAIKWLLTMNINNLVQDDDGMTALMYAAKDSNLIFVIKHFILNENCLNVVDKNGENVLFHALNNSNALIELVKSKVNINQVNNKHESALLYCCKNELYIQFALLLTNPKIDPNLIDNNNKTVAMYLAEKGRFLELRALAKRNCNFNFINVNLESVLSLLIKKMYGLDENPYNINDDDSIKKMYYNYFRTLTTLIDLNCDFNIPVDDEENTAIMVFIIVKDFTTLEYVLRKSKNINLSKMNKNGENASSLYIKCNNQYICPLLTENPTFDYHYIDRNNNNTILMLTSMNRPSLVYKVIQSNIFSVDEVNNNKENALILAVKTKNLKSVEELLKYHININHQDYLGNTALYYAVELNNLSLIKQLMYDSNININIKNNEGKSALDLANEIGNNSIIHILNDPSSASLYSSSSSLSSSSSSPLPSYNYLNGYQDQFIRIRQRVAGTNSLTTNNNNSNNEKSIKSIKNKNLIKDKYEEIEEYLYPWISTDYSKFTITKNYRLAAKNVYYKEIFDPEQLLKSKHTSNKSYDDEGNMVLSWLGIQASSEILGMIIGALI